MHLCFYYLLVCILVLLVAGLLVLIMNHLCASFVKFADDWRECLWEMHIVLCFTNYRLHMAATDNKFRTLINLSHTKLAINKNCSREILLHCFLQKAALPSKHSASSKMISHAFTVLHQNSSQGKCHLSTNCTGGKPDSLLCENKTQA